MPLFEGGDQEPALKRTGAAGRADGARPPREYAMTVESFEAALQFLRLFLADENSARSRIQGLGPSIGMAVSAGFKFCRPVAPVGGGQLNLPAPRSGAPDATC